MGQPSSADLRERVVAFVAAGHSRRSAARHFYGGQQLRDQADAAGRGLGLVRARPPRAAAGHRQAGALHRVPDRRRRGQARRLTAMRSVVRTMPELRDRLVEAHGVSAEPAALSRFLCRHGFTYEKRPDGGGRFDGLSAHAPTWPRRAVAGSARASNGCATSPLVWCSSTRPRSPPRWCGCAATPGAALGCPAPHRSATGTHKPLLPVCAAANSARHGSSTRLWTHRLRPVG